jgi:hypothetical protein
MMEFWRGFIIALVLMGIVLAYVFLAGCAHAPYYSGTATQHEADAAGYHP